MWGRHAVRELRVVLGFLVFVGVLGCDPDRTVYVTARALNLREMPNTRAPVLARLERGDELIVRSEHEAWLKVKTGKGVLGWVHGNYVGDPEAVQAAAQRSRTRHRKGSSGAALSGGPAISEEDRRLDLTMDQLLAGFPDSLVIEERDPLDGELRHVGAVGKGKALALWGEPENLTRASLVIPVVDVPDSLLLVGATLAVRFVRNAVPRWRRTPEWMADSMRRISSKDKGQAGFDADGKAVRFEFIKPLGAVRVIIRPEDA
ncbi:MAG: SH3 domain-containing protein [Candidatus Latescibacteria bacterium]|jgi:hypothetical protein|nr:SH3 domain-containing protein [Candidatus Latescibacterota bacterium]